GRGEARFRRISGGGRGAPALPGAGGGEPVGLELRQDHPADRGVEELARLAAVAEPEGGAGEGRGAPPVEAAELVALEVVERHLQVVAEAGARRGGEAGR